MAEPTPGVIRLDAVGGIAGDMFIAACLDAWPHLHDPVFAAIRAAGLPEQIEPAIETVSAGGFRASAFRLRGRAPTPSPTGSYREIADRLERLLPVGGLQRNALGLLATLAKAEAAVHGIAIDAVHFHELADWDSIADVVGGAAIIGALGDARWHCGPLPLGGGRIGTRHGTVPVPAPATARLLEGFVVVDDGIEGERVTPTGAAILRFLGAAEPSDARLGRLTASGSGAGTRELPGTPNILRILAFEGSAALVSEEPVLVATCEIDDQSPEDLAIATDALRAMPGVLDVTVFVGHGKKGRIVQHLQVLAQPAARTEALNACLAQTATLGVRWRIERRQVLARRSEHTDEGHVKVVRRPGGGVTAKLEADDVAASGADYAGRRQQRRTAEAAAEEGVA